MRLKDLVPTVGDTIGEHSLATGCCLYHLRVVLILSLWERSLWWEADHQSLLASVGVLLMPDLVRDH